MWLCLIVAQTSAVTPSSLVSLPCCSSHMWEEGNNVGRYLATLTLLGTDLDGFGEGRKEEQH